MSLCPIENSDRVGCHFHDDYKDLVQHLWGHHGFDAPKACELASTVASPPRIKHKTPKSKIDKASTEFLNKQLTLPGVGG